MAWHSFNQAAHNPSIAAVQTAIILILKVPTSNFILDSSFKYSVLGSAVSVANSLGLNLDPSRWQIPTWQIRLRRRLSWALFTIDTWLPMSLGRPRHISPENWIIDKLMKEDIEEEYDPGSKSVDLLLRSSKLTNIVDSILRQLL
jgi:hypothetical protein